MKFYSVLRTSHLKFTLFNTPTTFNVFVIATYRKISDCHDMANFLKLKLVRKR